MSGLSKLIQLTVNSEGQLTAATTDPVPVVKTDGSQVFTANQDMGGQRITDAADPVSAQDYATKAYVDAGRVTPVSNPGALVLLEQHTAATSATLDFTTFYSSLYDEYVFEFVNLTPVTNNVTLQALCSTNGGSSYDTSSIYVSSIFEFNSSGSATQGNAIGSPTTAMAFSALTNVQNSSAYGIIGFARLFSPASTSQHKFFVGESMYNATVLQRIVFGCEYQSLTAVNAVRFLFSSGNLASGTIRCYGVAKSANAGSLAVASATEVYRSTAQTLTHATDVAITFDTVTFDIDSMWASTPNPTRLTAQQTGKFYVTGRVTLPSGFAGTIHTRIYKTGSLYAEVTSPGLNLSSGNETHEVSALMALTSGSDYVELHVQADLQAGSGTVNTVGGATATFMSAFTTGGAGGTGDIKSNGSVPFAANESMGGFKLTNVATPTVSTDAATKGYVDAAVAPAPILSRVYQGTSPESIPVATDTAINFDTVDSDTAGFWSSGSPSRMTIPSRDGGAYQITAQVKFSLGGAGDCFLRLKKNGSTLVAESYTFMANTSATVQIAAVVDNLNSGDYLEVYVNQNTATPAATVVGIADTYIALVKTGGGGGSSLPATTTAGDLMISNGTEYDTVGTGGSADDKKVLTADSSQTHGVAWDYPGRTLLATLSLTGASVTFTGFLSAFDEYEIEIVDYIPVTSGAGLYLFMSTNGGSTYLASYSYNYRTMVGGSAITGSLAAQLQLCSGVGGLNTSGGNSSAMNGSFKFFQQAGRNPDVVGHCGGFNSGGSRETEVGGGVAISTTTINGLKFTPSTGNFSSGTIRIYGVRSV